MWIWILKLLEPMNATEVIAYATLLVVVLGGGVALFNARKSVLWKRAELANSYLKDFHSNEELVFAGRCLDWKKGRLVLPEGLRPYIPSSDKFIVHDRKVFEEAFRPNPAISEMEKEPRIQIYRIAIDSFLSWLALVASALDNKLFLTTDIQNIGYWVTKVQNEVALNQFIDEYGYRESLDKLRRYFPRRKAEEQSFVVKHSAPSAPQTLRL